MLALTFCIAVLLQIGTRAERCTTLAKLDLQIIVDSSGSVQQKNFDTMMKAISRSLISQFDIGEDKTRVALFKYSQRKVMSDEFLLNAFNEKKLVQNRIEATKFEKGNTMTAMAMQNAFKSFKALQRNDEQTAKVCIVFTDGEASDKDDVPAASKMWLEDGVTVFAVGIGNNIKRPGLEAIAGKKGRVMILDDFSAIAAHAKALLKEVCQQIAKAKPSVEDRVFRLHQEKKSWEDASKTCQAEGGELIKVDIPYAQNWLAAQHMKYGELWIGASDEGHEGKFTWADRQEATKEYWSQNNPDNWAGNQNCACVNWVHPGHWDDQNCQTKHAFVCQYSNKDWVNVGGRFLKFYSTPMTFNEANAVCAAFGGLVVCDDHPSVNKHLAQRGGHQWIGGTDNGHEGKWTWTNGVAMPKGHWFPGEPNNCCGGQNCAVVNFKKPGLWDDEKCDIKLPFHCQVHRIGYVYGLASRVLKVHPERKSWQDAAAICHTEGGELVKVDHPTVQTWVARQDMKMGELWIGASDTGHEGKFTWSDGQEATKEYWSPNNPDNWGGNQNCACVNWQHPGHWDDQDCQTKHAFVCQVMF